MTDTTRLAQVDKIRALLAKTVANGCTEHEAASALALAEKLMAKYNISRDDVTPRTSNVTNPLNDFFAAYMREEKVRRYQDFVANQGAKNSTSNGRARTASKYCAKCGRRFHADYVNCPSCPVDPAPKPRADAPRARANGSHANCTHEATKSARAKCRRAS